VPQLSSETEVFIALLCQLCSIHYTTVQIKNGLKSAFVIKIATMKNMDNFHNVKEAITSHATTKSTLFTVNKGEWNTKEDTGKSLKNALDILWYAKRHLSG